MNKEEKYDFEVNDFELVQATEKIYDKKFETKQTTFTKDALKRFTKNRASVMGGVIIGIILLLSLFVPLLSPYEVKNSSSEKLLTPKLFEAGTGFWDGTYKISNTLYNVFTETTSYNSSGIVEDTLVLTEEGENFLDVAATGAYGGTLVLGNAYTYDVYYKNMYGITFTQSDDFDINFLVSQPTNQLDVLNNKYGDLGEYNITVDYYEVSSSERTSTDVKKTYTLTSTTTSYTTKTFNSVNLLSDLNLSTMYDAQFSINIPATSNKSYITLDAINFTINSVNDDVLVEELEFKSINDVNNQLLTASNEFGIFPQNYWVGNADDYVSQANVIYASFRYDPYNVVYGEREVSLTESQIIQYIEEGLMKLDLETTNLDDAVATFEILSDDCPIVSFTSYENYTHPLLGDVTTITAVVTGYKYMGYSSAPKFIFGTNDSGIDSITHCFSGLSTSLMIAIFATTICIAIGIVWGSLSGYYGGKVDLFMERVLDVIARIPSAVLYTLTILLLGNNVWVFLFALCLRGWVGVASSTRTQFYRYKGREYVLVSRTLGAKDRRLIFKHILPNGLGTIITGTVLMVPGFIFTEASLAYLGLGLKGTNTIGVLLQSNQTYLQTYPMLVLFPAFIISLLMISCNLFGNGLRDAVNPSLKGSE